MEWRELFVYATTPKSHNQQSWCIEPIATQITSGARCNFVYVVPTCLDLLVCAGIHILNDEISFNR